MKKAKFLFLVPALFSMVACGLGSEVDAAKAMDLANAIAKANTKFDNVSLKITSESKGTDAGKSVTEYKANSKGDMYLKEDASGKSDGKDVVEKMEIYIVANDEYEEVAYMKSYDQDTKKDEIVVYVKKNNPLYDVVASSIKIMAAIGTYMVETPNQAPAIVAAAEASKKLFDALSDEEKAGQSYEVKYYSKGDLNLSVQTKAKAKAEDENGKEITIEQESVDTFDKGLFVEEKVTSKSSNGGGKMEMKVSYPSSLNISLPNGWKDHIEK